MITKHLQRLMSMLSPSTRCADGIQAMVDRGDLASALFEAERVMDKYPHQLRIPFLYSRIQIHRNEMELARASLLRIVEKGTMDRNMSIDVAEMLHQVGEHDCAINIWRDLGNQDSSHKATEVFARLINQLYRTGRYVECLEAAIQACNQGGGVTWYTINEAISRMKKDELAICHARMMQSLQENNGKRNAHFYKLLSLLDIQSGDNAVATKHMETAARIRFESDYPDVEWSETSPSLKPAFLIIGAMKCATTSLFNELEHHPDCLSTLDKEIQFFQYSHLPEAWYLANFPRVSESGEFITGDGSPGYYCCEVVDRVKKIVPDAKLIFIQRDPARRALSHLKHNNKVGFDISGTDDVLAGIDELQEELLAAPEKAEQVVLDICSGRRSHNIFLAMGCYELCLRQWRRGFPPAQLLTIEFEQFVTEPQVVMNRVFEFLELKPVKVKGARFNTGRYIRDEKATEKVTKRLDEFFDAVAKLAD